MTNTIFKPLKQTNNDDFQKMYHNMFHKPIHQVIEDVKNLKTPAFSNIYETDDRFHIQITVPGYTKENITITVEDQKLKVKGRQDVDKNVKYVKQEYKISAFERTFVLPDNVQTDNIEANSENGILNIIVFKIPEKSPLNIEIK